MKYRFVVSMLSVFALGCEQKSPVQETAETTEQGPAPAQGLQQAPRVIPKKKPAGYKVPERTSAELNTEMTRVCETATEEKKRVLLEFSAPWCGDCRKLAEMKTDEVLRQEMAATPHVVVNVGRFNRHTDLLQALKIRAIANWQVVEPTDCSAPVDTWKRIAHRTLEPQSGRKKVSSDELAKWLKRFIPKAG